MPYPTSTVMSLGSAGAAQLEAGAVATAKLADAAVTTAKLATALQSRNLLDGPVTVPTTATVEFHFLVPHTGVLSALTFSGKDTLAASDTNYVTFSCVNKGVAGAGATAMLAATDANTSKVTGGTAITAFVPRALTLHGTPANLNVIVGELLVCTVTATGTLLNTITNARLTARFTPS